MQTLISKTAFLFYLIAMVGMLSHSMLKWAKGEIRGNVLDWYIVNPRMSVLALLTVIGGTAGLLLNGTVSDVALGAHVIAVFGIGYSFDSGMNRQ